MTILVRWTTMDGSWREDFEGGYGKGGKEREQSKERSIILIHSTVSDKCLLKT